MSKIILYSTLYDVGIILFFSVEKMMKNDVFKSKYSEYKF